MPEEYTLEELHKMQLGDTLSPVKEESKDKGFLPTLGSDIKNIIPNLYNTVRHPYEATKGLIQAHMGEASKAKEAYNQGDYPEMISRALSTVTPLGPTAQNALSDVEQGRTGQGSARLLELSAPGMRKIGGDIGSVLSRPGVSTMAKGTAQVGAGIGSTAIGHPIIGFGLGARGISKIGEGIEQFRNINKPWERTSGNPVKTKFGGSYDPIAESRPGVQLKRGEFTPPEESVKFEPFKVSSRTAKSTKFGGSYEPEIKAKPGTQLQRGEFKAPESPEQDYGFKINPKTKALIKGSSSAYDPIADAKPGKILSRKLNNQEVVELTKVVRDTKTGKFKSKRISSPEE